MISNYEIFSKDGHYEVYINNEFYCTADTFQEGLDEVETYYNEVAYEEEDDDR